MWFQNKRCKDKKKAIQAEAARMHQQQALQAGAANVRGWIGYHKMEEGEVGRREGRKRKKGGSE